MIAEIRIVKDDGQPGEILPDWSSLNYLDPDNEAGQVVFEYPDSGVRADLIKPSQEYALLIDGVEAQNGRFRLEETKGNRISEGTSWTTWTGPTLMARFEEALIVPRRLPRAKEDVLTPEERKYQNRIERYEARMRRYRRRLREWKRNGEKGDKPREPRGYRVDNRLEKGLDGAPPPKSPTFRRDTPGQVLRYLVQLAHERSAIPEITLGFGPDRDSAGKKWRRRITQRWDVGSSIYDVIQWMADNQKAEFRMVGRKLMAYNPGTGIDRMSPHVVLARGKNLLDGPIEATSRDLATSVFCVSDTGVHGWVRDGALIRKHGRIEATLSVSGIREWDDLAELGHAYLANNGEPRYQYTYGVVPGKGADPYKDYFPGDWIYVLDGETAERRRVRQIGLSFDQNRQVKIAVTVNDLITEREIARAKQVRSMVGRTASTSFSSSAGGSRSGLTPAQESDGVAPAKPSSPKVTARAGAATFVYDGTDVDGEEAAWDTSHVELHVSAVEPNFEIANETLVDPAVIGSSTVSGFEYETPLYAKWVAVDAGGDRSEASDPVEFIVPRTGIYDVDPEVVQPGGPTTDGDPPSGSPAPEVIPGIGAFYLRWLPPVNADPLTFEVHVSATVGFTPDATTKYTETTSYSATVRSLVTIDAETGERDRFSYETPYYFRIIAKDEDDAAAPGLEVSSELIQVTSGDVALNTLTAENINLGTLTGDLFSGSLIMGSTISTGALDEEGNLMGARIDLGPAGFEIFDSAGGGVLSFPLSSTDAAYVRAHMDLLSAEVRGNFTMRGTNNQIATGSELTIAAGVTSPASPPQVTDVYDQASLDTTTVCSPVDQSNPDFNMGSFSLNPSQITGLAWDSVFHTWVVCQQRSNGVRFWHINSDGSLKIKPTTGLPWVDDWRGYSNASVSYNTQHTNTAFLGKYSNGDWYAWGMTPAGQSEINRIPHGWILDSATRPPAIGYDSVNNQYMLAQNNPGVGLHVRRFTFNVGDNPNATSVSVWQAESGSSRRIHGVYYGPAVHGTANRYAMSSDDWLKIYVFDAAGVERDEAGTFEEWNKPNSSLGFAADEFGVFASVDASGVLTYYTAWNWLEKDVQTHIGMSAFDSDPAGISSGTSAPHAGQTAGTHESPVGERIVIDQPRRAKLRITVPETNDAGGADDPDKWKIYYYRGSNPAPAAADFKLVATIGSPTSTTTVTIGADPTGAAPPGGLEGTAGAVNNFPGGDPGRFESAAFDGAGPLIQLKGDGAGRIGGWKWGTDGKTDINSGPERPGSVLIWPGTSIPLDTADCLGQAVSRPISAGGTVDTFKRVWEAHGTTWGAGDGTTTFNLPDYRRRFLMGAHAAGADPVGSNDGIADVSARSPYHNHNAGTLATGGPTGTGDRASGTLNTPNPQHTHTVTGATSKSLGLNSTDPTDRFPYATVHYVIKL